MLGSGPASLHTWLRSGQPQPEAGGAAVLSVLPAPFVLLPSTRSRLGGPQPLLRTTRGQCPCPPVRQAPAQRLQPAGFGACSQGAPCHQGRRGSACPYAGTRDASVHFSAGPRLLISHMCSCQVTTDGAGPPRPARGGRRHLAATETPVLEGDCPLHAKGPPTEKSQSGGPWGWVGRARVAQDGQGGQGPA